MAVVCVDQRSANRISKGIEVASPVVDFDGRDMKLVLFEKRHNLEKKIQGAKKLRNQHIFTAVIAAVAAIAAAALLTLAIMPFMLAVVSSSVTFVGTSATIACAISLQKNIRSYEQEIFKIGQELARYQA